MPTNRLPFPLSERIASATTNIYNRQGREVDVAISGIPFRLATGTELPHSFDTIPVRKDQVDTEQDPGEQTLSGWWRRAQASWHEGAGFLYQEDSASLTPTNGFFDSRGVDVFTKGRITLLKKMVQNATAGTFSRARFYGTSGSVSAVGNGALFTGTSASGTLTSLHAPASKTIIDGLISDTHFYDVATDGSLYEGTVASPGTATTWPLGGAPTRLGWGAHRLWVIGGRDIWQPNLALTGGTAQVPEYTNPNRGWKYTCMAEGPSAMFFGGHDGATSTIQAVTLDINGDLPTLSGATVATVLPDGELVQEIAVLAGQFVGIGTSAGFRVGVLDGSRISYGPLLFEPDNVQACTAITTQGRFFLVAFEASGDTGRVYRVDTGAPSEDGVFPYASDVDTGIASHVTSLSAGRDGNIVLTATNGKFWSQGTNYVDTGYIQTGRIRYRTTEKKFFRSLTLEVEPLAGTLGIDLIREGDSTQEVGSMTTQGSVREDPFLIGGQSLRYGSIKITLNANSAKTGAPVINSYQLTAYPAVRPQRLITLPLLCYDKEKSHSGQWYGGAGFAIDRLTALQGVEDQGELVTFQDFTLSASGQLVMIERIRFIQTSPAISRVGATGPGGILLVELRTVDGT